MEGLTPGDLCCPDTRTQWHLQHGVQVTAMSHKAHGHANFG